MGWRPLPTHPWWGWPRPSTGWSRQRRSGEVAKWEQDTVSIGRVAQCDHIEQEAPSVIQETKPPKEWPQHGRFEYLKCDTEKDGIWCWRDWAGSASFRRIECCSLPRAMSSWPRLWSSPEFMRDYKRSGERQKEEDKEQQAKETKDAKDAKDAETDSLIEPIKVCPRCHLPSAICHEYAASHCLGFMCYDWLNNAHSTEACDCGESRKYLSRIISIGNIRNHKFFWIGYLPSTPDDEYGVIPNMSSIVSRGWAWGYVRNKSFFILNTPLLNAKYGISMIALLILYWRKQFLVNLVIIWLPLSTFWRRIKI